ncbi:hypothetical protein J5N97_006286 [Dioscorea zingiberensis]|uniref:Agenet domain-containing protein n=1 Tax=Dioscorea zingiberensis TaxID=325984 RepID=A0A9D5HSM8_9LILI|nr:hypothetical protein J5N97_006286 [Dioscorea zingiberensis]
MLILLIDQAKRLLDKNNQEYDWKEENGKTHIVFGIIANMKFKKGSKVEVLNTREAPLSSWWCAEIIFVDGRNYVVKYDRKSTDMGASVERVSREVIRPCPPPAKIPRSWVPGDITEVFDYGSWKLSVVLKVIEGDYFIVRLLGSHRRFRVHASDLRVRQSWQDNKWNVIGQDSRKCDDGKVNRLAKEGKFSNQIAQCSSRVEDRAGGHYLHFSNCNVNEECFHLLSKSINKRTRASFPSVNARNVACKKRRGSREEGRLRDNFGEHLPHLLEKVVAVASPQKVMGEIYMYDSLNNRTTGFSQMDMARRKPSGDVEYDYVTRLEPNDAGTMSSSVGSCSTSDSQYMPLHPMTCHVEGLKLEACKACFLRSKMMVGIVTFFALQMMWQGFHLILAISQSFADCMESKVLHAMI